jgi:predicted permease
MRWIRRLFQKSRAETDLDKELRFHLDRQVADYLAAGLSAEEARRRAKLEFGGLDRVKEEVRDTRWETHLDNLFRDIRYALRTLRKSPGFTAVAILTLALGIGANTAIFSVVNTVLLRSLPFPYASQLLDISARSTLFDFPNLSLSLPDLADVRASARSLSTVAPYQYSLKELTGDDKPERIESADVSVDFFPLLGLNPLYGRIFTSSDIQPGSHVVVISYSLWRKRFGGDMCTVGKSVIIDGQPSTIIGVMPPQQQIGFPTDFQLWAPLVPTKEQLASRENRGFSVLAGLTPNANLALVKKELDTIADRLATAYPEADKGWSIHATPLKKYLLGDATAPLSVLFSAVGFVLLIACANVSNLFLSRGWARRREFAVRAAIGATRGALLRQLTVECVLVALAGGACAFLIAAWTMQGLRAVLPPEIPRLQDLRMDSAVGWFTLGTSLFAAFLSGLAPALLAVRQDINLAMKGGAGIGAGGPSGHNFLRRFLVVGEVALALVLLVGATLALQSFARLLRVDLGFRPNHLVTMRMDFPRYRFAKSQQAVAFVQQILDTSQAIPGVDAVSAGLVFPLGDAVAETIFQTTESPKDLTSGEQSALSNLVAPNFFRALSIPLLAGRDFKSTDTDNNSPVFIVNEALANKVFGSIDVLGKRVSTRKESGHPIWGEIVGVAGNVREARPGAEPKPEVYASFYQSQRVTGVYLIVRTKPEPMGIVSAIQDRVWSLDKNQPITAIKTAEAQISEINAAPRSQSLLLGIFGALGFVLALIGVYGVMSYLVSQQTREIGIRMALGADPQGILRLVLSHGLKLTGAGVAIGVITSLALTRFMRSLLFGISATDPVTFAGVAVSLTLVALGACYIPARRATRVDPMLALRYE